MPIALAVALAVVTRTRIGALPNGIASYPQLGISPGGRCPPPLECTMSSHQTAPYGAPWIPPGVIRLVRLKREGALARGDLVATRHLGTCEVINVESTHAISVRALETDTQHRLHCVFGPGVSLSDA